VLSYLHNLVDLVIQNENAPQGSIIEVLKLAADPDSKEHLSSAELKDESLSILLAGHETLTNTLGWATYLLSKPENQRVQEKLVQEIDAVLGDRDDITLEDFEKMTYCQAVIMESLRIYPTVPLFPRFVENGTVLAGKYDILPQSIIVISNMNMGNDARYYEKPEEFLPERHLETLNMDRKRDFFPFGGGHRMCIGKRLAQVESVMVLSKFLQKFQSRLQKVSSLIPNLSLH